VAETQTQTATQPPPIDFSDLGGRPVSPAPATASPGASQGSAAGSIDFSDLGGRAITPAPTSNTKGTSGDSDTGIWAGVKRNTVGAITGLYHAFTAPATDQERNELAAKVDEANANGDKIPLSVAYDPSRATLAYHRLIDAPADVLNKKGQDEQAAAHDLLHNGQALKGAGMYLSGLTDRGLAAVPLLGPAINSIAQRYESGDTSGAATDLAAALALENAKPIAKAVVGKAGEMLPSAQKARAGQAFQDVSSAVGSHTVPMTDDLSGSLMNYQKLVDTGSSRSATVNRLLQRVTDPSKGPLTYDEARLWQSNVSRLSADESMRLTPQMKRVVGQIANNLSSAVSATAESGGKLEQFQDAMQGYRRASQIQNIHDSVLDALKEHGLKGLIYGAGTGIGGGVLYKVIKDALAK
jgi:hypothetical protein